MNDLSKKVEECLIASAWVKPESRIFDSPEIYKVMNKSVPYEFMNVIYRTQLSEGEADAAIFREYQNFKNNNVSFRWYLFPHSTPVDLDARLRKLKPRTVTDLQGLYCETDHPSFTVPKDITVEALNRDNLHEYVETNIAGWNQSGAEAEKIRGEIRADFEAGTKYSGFLARVNGRPAATGMTRIVNGAGYFFGGATRPDLRGKGAYRGLLSYRIKQLLKEGIPLAFVLARSASSAPICRKLGFKIACDVRSYEFI